MAVNVEMREVPLSTESRPLAPRTPKNSQPEESAPSNRRRVVTGVALSGLLLAGTLVWQYFDERAARPPAAVTSEEPVVGDGATTDANP